MPETAIPPPPEPTQLIVFADDWGRHPSSSQHLIRQLLPQYPTLWVNTVGTRAPKMTLSDLQRGFGVLSSWLGTRDTKRAASDPDNFRLAAPKMYPGYRNRLQRMFNRSQVARAVRSIVRPGHRRVVLTTLPMTADLVGALEADRWIYYCVDDYAQWPGTDCAVMQAMEQELVNKVDAITPVSTVLADRLERMGQSSKITGLLEHGVDLERWASPRIETQLPDNWPDDRKPIALFWGLLDARMDVDWLRQLAETQSCELMMTGPQAPDCSASIAFWCKLTGPAALEDLPAYAAASNVLIMPYIDAPVTRAMQPLKLLEYLATMKPVVVRDLPATRAWADCCDLATRAEDFARLVQERGQTGTPAAQIEARKKRLADQSWTAKASRLAAIINDTDAPGSDKP